MRLKPIYFPLQCPFLEENQCELLQNNGLPLMIQVLTESQDEELNKAATFVLQNCKQMSKLTVIALKIMEMISTSKFCCLSKLLILNYFNSVSFVILCTSRDVCFLQKSCVFATMD